jgi:membrane-bound serine protease (ClpP class)
MTRSLLSPLLLGLLLALGAQPSAGQVLRVVAMPTSEELRDVGRSEGIEINESFRQSFLDHLHKAAKQGADIVVVEITTPGGEVGVTELLVKDLENYRHQYGVRTVAYVPDHATSAGAILALACKEIILGPGASIGNAMPIEFSGMGGVREAERKYVDGLIKIMDQLATWGGFDQLLLRAMVDADLEIYALWTPGQEGLEILTLGQLQRYQGDPRSNRATSNKLLVGTGSALSVVNGGVTTVPWFETVFPYKTAMGRHDLPRLVGLEDRPLSSEEVLSIPPPRGVGGFLFHLFSGLDWSLLLLVAGIVCFIMEFKTPGLGIFGVLGILSLIGYFALNSGEGLPLAFSIGLLLLGFFLILAEILIFPGFGVAGISGIVLVLFSVYAATIDLGGDSLTERLIPDTSEDWVRVQAWMTLSLGMLVVGTGGALFIARNLHHVPILRRAFVVPPAREAVAETSPTGVTSHGRVKVRVGSRGTADTDLRPSGRATFVQGVLDVVSDGGWIRRGSTVEVVLVEGHRVVVGPAADHSPSGEES